MLAFTVARRTREIGVRVALGGSRGRVIAAIFRRPLTQVAIGVVLGGALVFVATSSLADGGLTVNQIGLLVAHVRLLRTELRLSCRMTDVLRGRRRITVLHRAIRHGRSL